MTDLDCAVKYINKKIYPWSGVSFTGSPRAVFWDRYIEPFLEDCTERLINLIGKESEHNKLNTKAELDILSHYMRNLFSQIYNEMASADQRMMNMGSCHQKNKEDVTQEIIHMNHYLDQHIAMALNKHGARNSLKTKFMEDFKEQAIQKLAKYSIVVIIFILGWVFTSEYIATITNFIKGWLK